jgi:retron-type reverse transcriptase
MSSMSGGWVIDLDIKAFFDTIDHQHLRDVLQQRVKDGVVLRLIGKWLKAGVVELLSNPVYGKSGGSPV